MGPFSLLSIRVNPRSVRFLSPQQEHRSVKYLPPNLEQQTSAFIALIWYPTNTYLNSSNFRRPGAYHTKSTVIILYFHTLSFFFLVFRPGTSRPGTDGLFLGGLRDGVDLSCDGQESPLL